MNTGENEQGLRKIVDLTRMISIVLILLHFYYYCYATFRSWHLRSDLTDHLLLNVAHSGLFSNFARSKLMALIFLAISLFGARGKKDQKYNYKTGVLYILSGALFYFLSGVLFYL